MDEIRREGDPQYNKLQVNPMAKRAEDYQVKREVEDPWKHRSEGMRCKSCIWFVPKQPNNKLGYDLGRCRRHAPSMGGYPVVYVNDWCGDHRIDENKV